MADEILQARRRAFEDYFNNPPPSDTTVAPAIDRPIPEELMREYSLRRAADAALQNAANAFASGAGYTAANRGTPGADAVKAQISEYLARQKEDRDLADAMMLAQAKGSSAQARSQAYPVKGMVDAKTGNMVQYDSGTKRFFYVDEAGNEVPVQKAVPAKQYFGGGKGGAPKPEKATADQTSKAITAVIGQEAARQYDEAVAKGQYDPTSYSKWLDQQDWVPNLLKTGTGIEAGAAESAWVEAFLRDASGAAIASSERSNYAKDFFPRAGDTPETVANKSRLRQLKEQALISGAGPAWMKVGKPSTDMRYDKTFAPAPDGGGAQKSTKPSWAE